MTQEMLSQEPAGELVATSSEPLAPKEGCGAFVKLSFEGIIRGFRPAPGVVPVQVFLHQPNGRPLEKVIGEAVNVGDFLTIQLRNDTDQIQTARGHWIIERKAGATKTAPSPAAAPPAVHPAAQGPQALARIAVAKMPAPREEVPMRAAVTATPPPSPSTMPEMSEPMPEAGVPVATPAQVLGAARSLAKGTGEVLVLMHRAQAMALLGALKLKGETIIHGSDLAPLTRALEDALRT